MNENTRRSCICKAPRGKAIKIAGRLGTSAAVRRKRGGVSDVIALPPRGVNFGTQHLPGMRLRIVAVYFAALVIAPGCGGPTQSSAPPIIDMHLHAHTLSMYGTPLPAVCTNDQDILFPGVDPREPVTPQRVKSCPRPLAAPGTDEEVLKATLDRLERVKRRRDRGRRRLTNAG